MALFDAFLKLDGIKGESADAKHKGEIDIESFSWGMSQTGVSATGGGGGAGKVQVHDISLWKKTDASSPLLFLNCANGAHIKEATFVVRKAGGEQLEYLKIKLTDVLVSSYQPCGLQDSGDEGALGSGGGQLARVFRITNVRIDGTQLPVTSGGSVTGASPIHANLLGGTGPTGEIPSEHFSLNFAKIEMSYQPQGADGKAQGGPIMAGWDVKGNVKA